MRSLKRLFTLLLTIAICLATAAIAKSETAPEETNSEELTANGYVLVTAGNESRWFPLPDDEPYSFTIRQTAVDGSEMNNTITITTTGAYMQDSDCEGQDCVGEGTVTLENKDERVLGNMIICLPHQITIELYSVEELTVDESKENDK